MFTPDRGDVDDLTGTVTEHHRDDCAAAVEDGRQVRIKDGMPFCVCHILQQTGIGDTGVINQKVYRSFGSVR